MKSFKLILVLLFVLFIVSVCYAASENIFSPTTIEWLKLISGFITVAVLPLIGIVLNQGKNAILKEIRTLSSSFDNHWHDIDCPNTECNKARTSGLNVSQPRYGRRFNDE